VSELRTTIASHEHELIALRRHLHAQPEESGKEHLTTELLVERLMVEGLKPTVLACGTGVVCDIPLDGEAHLDPATVPVVALRADIDALAMVERTDAPYRSRFPGFAHACGHDVHTAAVLGAALALLEVQRNSPRRGIVRLIFEPAEEAVPGGAVDVIAEGWLDHVRSIYGVHCDPKLDVGQLGIRVGALTSAADQFELTLTGPGGHTARPRQTVDLVRWSARVVERLWDAVQARLDEPVILVFGAVHAGAAANVIPSSSTLRGSFRTADRPTWAAGVDAVRAALEDLMAGDDIGAPPDWELDYTRGLPPVVNDAGTTELVRAVTMRQFGLAAVAPTPHSAGGDSFAWYTEQVPGTYVRLGTHDPESGLERQDLHSATFDVDERAIAIGATLLAACALAAIDA
jgi:amidohydrolase